MQVLVIVGDPTVAFHEHLHIPWGFNGTIVFTLAGDDANTRFSGEGVKFKEPAPFVVGTPGLRRCDVYVNNNNNSPGIVGVSFAYDLVLTTGTTSFIVDPTVENDPPATVG
jgi:hypothetical protein